MRKIIEKRVSTVIALGILLATVVPLTYLSPASAQTASLWIKSYGEVYSDYARSVVETSDGGFAVAGSISSFGAEQGDAWLLKLDSNGNVLWQRAYRGTGSETVFSLKETADSGLVAAGSTTSTGDVFGDLWVLRLDAVGNVMWQRAYGGDRGDWARFIEQTADGGFVVVGNTESPSLGTPAQGDADVWFLKLDSNGNILRQKRYGGGLVSESALSAQQTSDGGLVVAGSTGWVFKLDANWNILWQKRYSLASTANSVRQTFDGGFIVAGTMITGTIEGFPIYDYLVMRLDSDGNILWEKRYGGSSDDVPNSVRQTSDGGFIVAGRTSSPPAGAAYAPLLLKLDANGNILWSKVYSFPFIDVASVLETADSELVAAVGAASGIGSQDFVVMRLDSNGDVSPSCSSIQLFNATAINTSATVSTSSFAGADTAAAVTITTAATIVTSAIVLTLCSTEPIPSPDLATDITKIANKKVRDKFRTTVEVKVTNIGDASAPSTRLTLYISQDAILDNGDTALGGKTLDSISPGGYATSRFTFEFSTNPASLWIIAQADAFNEVTEPNEANNVDSAQIPSFR